MSTITPLRTIRRSALQRQYRSPQYQCLVERPIALANARSRPFSSTTPRARVQGKPDFEVMRAAARENMSNTPAPRVHMEQSQKEEGMSEDIGLLQNTIVRAEFSKLPSIFSKPFYSYMWQLFKSKGVALYGRSDYHCMIQKSGMSRYLPIDTGKNAHLKEQAKKAYEHIYSSFAKGTMRPIREICLSPLANKFAERIASRDNLKMNWRLIKWNSVRVVSHRAAPLGETHPDSGYRQVIVRLESTQSLSITGAAGPAKRSGRPTWMPAEAKMQRNTVEENESRKFEDNGKPKRVVEYLVMQTRLVDGREEEWRVQGFAQESTPETIKEDEEYWKKTLDTQIAGGESA